MKRAYLLITLLIFTLPLLAQVSFEAGYFVRPDGERVPCFIKNQDWKNNPTRFEYKLDLEGKTESLSIEDAAEFGINDKSKFVRQYVQIDKSARDIHAMDYQKAPKFELDTLFLKVLIDGEANLYLYDAKKLTRFFFNKKGEEVRQLVYKRYKVETDKVASNIQYMHQLRTELPCTDLTKEDAEAVEYKKRDLVRYFIKYHECQNEPFVNFYKAGKAGRDLFNLYLRAGVRIASLETFFTLDHPNTYTDFGSRTSAKIGLEFELILPFLRNRWGVAFEPTYNYFSGQETLANGDVLAEYKSIEIPIRLRHFIFIGDKSKISISGGVEIDLPFQSSILFFSNPVMEVRSRPNVSLGIGYNLNNRINAEVNFGTNRNILWNHVSWKGNYQYFALMVGYNIF